MTSEVKLEQAHELPVKPVFKAIKEEPEKQKTAIKPIVTPWSTEAYQLELTGMAKQIVINSNLLENEAGKIKLLVNSSIQPMMNEKMQLDVEAALSAFYNNKLSLSLEFSAELNAETPFEYQQRMDDEAKIMFMDDLNNSDFGIAMKQNFNAVLLEHSVKRIEHYNTT